MREIKLRAWDKTKKKWLNADDRMTIADETDFWWAWVQAISPDGVIHFVPDILNIEIVQYTGLKDKQGKDIYEGDIVAHSSNVFGLIHKGVVSQYFDGSWQVTYRRGDHPSYIPDERSDEKAFMWLAEWTNSELGNVAEVVGNIYENPELLEK